MKTGVVKNYIPSTRYGFITDDDGSGDIFVHFNQLKESGLNELNIGEKVSFKKQKKGNFSYVHTFLLKKNQVLGTSRYFG